jgi:pimeloyl-ACP methyl ester carboxylesterase
MDTVVVAHGLWMPGYETALLRQRIAAAGFHARLFRYRTVRASLTENAARLAAFCHALPGDRLHFVGHSLGGVVAVKMLAEFGSGREGHAVCLGSPLKGSLAGARLARLPYGRQIVGRSVLELNALAGLPPWHGPQRLGVIAGSRGLGMGLALGRLPTPNDGTVLVAETRLEGIADHLVLPVTHTSLMFSRAVAEATIAFLRHGRFRY